MANKRLASELRQDLVSGEWVVIAPKRALRMHEFARRPKMRPAPKLKCPFENPQKTAHGSPVLALNQKGEEIRWNKNNAADFARAWRIQIIKNKFPIVAGAECSVEYREGPFSWMKGAGFHEVIIYRDHNVNPSYFDPSDMKLMLEVYRRRYRELIEEDCSEYVLIFHNHGPEAGASISHPHSQIIALPIIPPDVARSIKGSADYYRVHGRCVHCDMIRWERKSGKRIVYENEEMIAFCPFASKVSFETRIFPKRHEARFDGIDDKQLRSLADALRTVLRKIARGLADPSYNFFIHTAPAQPEYFEHYHWHVEILPRTSIWAGVELGAGIEVTSVLPEQAARYLRTVNSS